MIDQCWLETGRSIVAPYDCDAQNHLNVAGYMKIFDTSILQLFFRLNYTIDDLDDGMVGWADVSHHIDYIAEARAGWPLSARGAVIGIGRKSITSLHEILLVGSGVVAARLKAVTVQFDLHTRTATPVLDAVRNAAQQTFATRLEAASRP